MPHCLDLTNTYDAVEILKTLFYGRNIWMNQLLESVMIFLRLIWSVAFRTNNRGLSVILKKRKSHNEMDVLLVTWRNALAVCQSVCNWAVGQFGSTVLIQGEPITWLCECFAIGLVPLRLVTVRDGRPSPLLFIRPAGYLAILFCCSLLCQIQLDAQATPQDGLLWTRRCLRRLHRRLSLVNL